MEYDDDDGVAGSIPEVGAIFMANVLTKKECFKRKIFGLPSSQAEFVKQVKAGMVLFLFEFKTRQLFGVYQACSDGAMNIVPHAFNYSGRCFPAQVCFTPIWHCDPLSEREFKDAIIENYFSANKFKFGLSENQVRRLLSLFSSRKMKKELIPRPLAESAIGVARKDKRTVDDKFELTERVYAEPTENDEFNPAAFSDYHANSLVKEDEVLIDDRVNNEGTYPLSQGSFLAKRRRIDYDDRLLASDMAENYNYGALQTFHIDSPRDSLDEVRKLAAVRKLLAVERVRKENEVAKIRSAILSSESVMDQLDVRTTDDDRFLHRNRLFDEYNVDNGFVSECYEKPLDTSKHAIDGDSFLFDDCVRGNQNIHDIVEPMVYGDGNRSLCRQATEVIEDYPCSMNMKLVNRCHLDRDVSPFSTFANNTSLLHETRETASGGRFSVNDRFDSEPNFGTYSVDDLSSAKFSRPLHCGQRYIHDRKYPIVEGRVTENMVGNTFCSTTATRNAGYSEIVGGRLVDDGSLRESEGVDSGKDFHTHIGPGISLGCPSSSSQKWSLPSFSDKFLPEKGRSQLNVAHNSGLACVTFDDATITRSTPYIPEHPNFSHGFNASLAANQTSSFDRINPHRGEDFYSSYKNRSPPYILESKKSSRSLDIASEFGNKGLPTNISGHQSSSRHAATSSFLNSDLSMHVDLNSTVPVNERGSLFSKSVLTPPANHEKFGGEGHFVYPSKPSGSHFSLGENPPKRSQHPRKHVSRQGMLAGKNFICSEAKDSSLGIYHSERDLTGYENQYFGVSSNMNCRVNREISEAPRFNSNVNRKSVFSRLASGEEFQGVEERNESGFDCHDIYMNATADEVMEMLRQSDNLPLRKLKKSIVVGQPKHGEGAGGEKQVRSRIEIKSSAMEEKKLKDARVAIEESITEVPKETRIMDFKRRSDTKKYLVGASTDSATCNKTTGANENVGNSMKATLKRKKLVRPVFGKAESATNAICSCQNSRVPVQINEKDDERNCEKAVSICEAEKPNDNTRSNKVLVSRTHQSMDGNIKEHLKTEAQNDIGVHVLPSSRSELKEHKTSVFGLHIGSSQALLTETTPLQTSGGDILSENVDSTPGSLNLEEQSSVESELGAGCLNNLIEDSSMGPSQAMDCTIKEHSNPDGQNDMGVHVLPSSTTDLKEHKKSLGPHIGSSQAILTETNLHMSVANQTSAGNTLSKNVDSTASNLDLEDSSAVGLELCAGCSNNLTEEKSPRLKRKKRIRKTKKTGMGPSQTMDCNINEQSKPDELNDIRVHVLPSSSTDLKEHKKSLGLHIDSSQALLTETTLHKSVANQTSAGDILSKNVDSIVSNLNLEDSSSVGLELCVGCSNNLTEEKSPMLKRRKKIRKTKKTGMGSSQTMDCNISEQSKPDEQNDMRVHVLPSTDLKEHNKSLGPYIDSSQVLTEKTLHKRVGNQTSVGDILSKNVDSIASNLNLEESSSLGLEIGAGCLNVTEEKGPRTLKRKKKIPKTKKTGIGSPQTMDCYIKEHPKSDEQYDMGVHVLPSSSTELKEHKKSIGLCIESSQALIETTPHKSVDIQTSIGDILSKNVDSTVSSLNLEEQSSVVLELGARRLINLIEEKSPRILKRKKKIIKIKKTNMEPSQ